MSELLSPPSPLGIIGKGRLARHLCHYLHLLGHPFTAWDRSQISPAEVTLTHCQRVFLAISDDQILPFITQNPWLEKKICLHGSGSLYTPLAHGIHPLMSFTPALYDLETYRSLPFVLESTSPPLSQLLPELPNPSFSVFPEDKPLYHALCVLCGNGTSLLWNKAMTLGEEKFGIHRQSWLPYLKRICENLEHPSSSLTGPLARGDQQTLKRNHAALEGDHYQHVFSALCQAHQKDTYEHSRLSKC